MSLASNVPGFAPSERESRGPGYDRPPLPSQAAIGATEENRQRDR